MNETKDGYFKIIIYYIGEANPTIIERGAFYDAKEWVHNIDNVLHFKNCDKWQIQDNKGKELSSGRVVCNIKIIEDE